MPPKPANPTSKDLEEAIQATEDRMENSLTATHLHFTEQIGMMNTKLDLQQQHLDARDAGLQRVLDERLEALTTLFTTALQNRQPEPPPRPSSGITTSPISSQIQIPQPVITSAALTQSYTTNFTPTPSTPLSTSINSTTTNSPLWQHLAHSQPLFTSTQIPVTLPTSFIYTSPPQPIVQAHNQQSPYTPFSHFTTAIPLGIFQHSQNPYSQVQQNPYLTPSPSHTNQQPFRTPKIELPLFDGTAPLEWVFQAEQFFSFYNISHENRLSLASFYMKGDALSWYKWMYQNHQLFDWSSFSKALELRFGPSTYENHQAQLFKLRQYGSVTEYQTQFEKLGNRVFGLPPEALLNCFVSGLLPEIRHELAVLKPSTITQAIGLAKLVESKIKEAKGRPTRPATSSSTNISNSSPHASKYHTSAQITNKTTISPTTNSTTPTTNSKLPIRRLTATQMQERRAQGLCYNCDEKYIIGHRCATGRYLLLILDSEDDTQTQDTSPDENEPETETAEIYFHLSPQALTGEASTKTKSLKFQGTLHGQPVSVLIDTGSTHNILQPRIAKHLHIPPTLTPKLSVMVGNGSHIQCAGFCPQVPLNLQNTFFHIPFYLFPIQGADVVLGMEWLETLGTISADFSIPSLSFIYDNSIVTLHGNTTNLPAPSTFHHICHLLHQDSVASMHLLSYNPTTQTDTKP